jgi:hypothetical protein
LLLPVKVVSPYYYTRTRKAPPDPVTRTPATLPKINVCSFAAVSSVALIFVWNSPEIFISLFRRTLSQPHLMIVHQRLKNNVVDSLPTLFD